MDGPDPKFIRLAQQLESERAKRIEAERKARMLHAVVVKLKAERQRTNDAAPKEQRPSC